MNAAVKVLFPFNLTALPSFLLEVSDDKNGFNFRNEKNHDTNGCLMSIAKICL
jgi:hypothetical protein